MRRQENVRRMFRSRNARSGIRVNAARGRRRFRISRRQILLIFGMLLCSMVSGIGYVWSNFERTQIGYELSELKREEMRLKEINRKLQLEIDMLRSPQYLERVAVEELGLRPPSPDQIILLP